MLFETHPSFVSYLNVFKYNWSDLASIGTCTRMPRGGALPSVPLGRNVSRRASWRALIDADVVDQEPVGQGRVVDPALATPVPADGDVQEQVLRGVERPGGPAVLRLAHE